MGEDYPLKTRVMESDSLNVFGMSDGGGLSLEIPLSLLMEFTSSHPRFGL